MRQVFTEALQRAKQNGYLTLISLDLNVDEVNGLAQFIRENKSVTRMHITLYGIEQAAIKPLVEAVKASSNLIEFNILESSAELDADVAIINEAVSKNETHRKRLSKILHKELYNQNNWGELYAKLISDDREFLKNGGSFAILTKLDAAEMMEFFNNITQKEQIINTIKNNSLATIDDWKQVQSTLQQHKELLSNNSFIDDIRTTLSKEFSNNIVQTERIIRCITGFPFEGVFQTRLRLNSAAASHNRNKSN